MFTTILIAVLTIVMLVLFSGVIRVTDGVETHALPRALGLIPLVIALIVAVFSTTAMVQAKQVGVLTTFGKTSEHTLKSGLHVKAPWQNVTEIDATIQTDEYHGDNCITVVLADKNTACISAANRWAVNPDNANDVYADFRSDDPTKSLRDAVVSTQFKAAVNDVFSTYDVTDEKAADYDALAAQVSTDLKAKTDGLVDIRNITISYIKPSEKLQDKIEAIQAQEAKTRIAEEAKTTAEKEAAANRILSDSISNDPNVLVSKCLDGLIDGSIANEPGFSCWGPGGAVVVPSK